MLITLPDFCLVMLIGPTASGKTTLARKFFSPDEVLSSDYFRRAISGDETDQRATDDAFDCLYYLAQKRLDRRKLTVIDATNLNKWARRKALDFARDNNCFCVAIALNIPESECQRNNEARTDRRLSRSVVRRHCDDFRRALKAIKKENFREVYVLNSSGEIDELEIERRPLWTDKSTLHGPFDIIGDIHGCYAELCALLRDLGYEVDAERFEASPPPGRTAAFLGDLCDRGPNSAGALRLVMNMTEVGAALCVPGNHDDKLARRLAGKKTTSTGGVDTTLSELEREDAGFRERVKNFLAKLVSHYILDDGKLVVCHAGLPARLQGRSSRYTREFCLYGDPTGKIDEYGLPERNDWARDYDGSAFVAYGHCPDPETRIVNNTVCLDAGCVFGGKLAALRYPEMEIRSVPALKEYYPSPKPLARAAKFVPPDAGALLKRQRLETSLGVVVIREEERSLAALEIMARFAVDPRWLIYLPPTMSPCETSPLPDCLEHPREALSYYRNKGIRRAICEEKHMGSRAIAVVCRDEAAAREYFVAGENAGAIYTRTGRPFFVPDQREIETGLLAQIREALNESDFWRKRDAEWVCLDCEITPWSYKAQSLINDQYAPYGLAGINDCEKTREAIERFRERIENSGSRLAPAEAENLAALARSKERELDALTAYNKVWRSYCRPANDLSSIKIAPFHILATNGKIWTDINHDEQLRIIDEHLGAADAFTPTRRALIDLNNDADTERAIEFWSDLLADGAEGMVVKPLDFIPRQGTSLLQPAIKCRGPEYLRIIYGADYLRALEKFKRRDLASKRRRALREFALGVDALELFVKGEPLHKVHERVFTILALESEPQDARL